ncbi:MAG TPA: Sec-independent protein translocase protein TatB [Quisquiliibacterium sp.]|nr:Sec-independent protein translocase protein TatB [Quisquiliibacterium sp.]
MFEVGFTEIVLILGIALLVLGPERLPKLAADLGRWAGKARAMARQLKGQLEQEAGTLNELRKPLDDIRNPLNDLRNPLDAGSQKSQTIHTPPAEATPPPPAEAPPAATAGTEAPPATPDRTDESKPA